MKILFLDLDGVANTESLYDGTTDPENTPPSFEEVLKVHSQLKNLRRDDIKKRLSDLHPRKLDRVNQIVSKSGAQIVASTTWRKHHSKDDLQTLLRARGLAFDILSYTPNLAKYDYDGTTRGSEIHAWLHANPQVTSIVILDDDDQMEPYRDRLVHVNPFKGLTDANVQQALTLLDAPFKIR